MCNKCVRGSQLNLPRKRPYDYGTNNLYLQKIIDLKRFVVALQSGFISRQYLYKNTYLSEGEIDAIVDDPANADLLKKKHGITIGPKET